MNCEVALTGWKHCSLPASPPNCICGSALMQRHEMHAALASHQPTAMTVLDLACCIYHRLCKKGKWLTSWSPSASASWPNHYYSHDMLAFRASPYDHFIDGDNDLDTSHSTDDDGVIDIVTLILTIHGQHCARRSGDETAVWKRWCRSCDVTTDLETLLIVNIFYKSLLCSGLVL